MLNFIYKYYCQQDYRYTSSNCPIKHMYNIKLVKEGSKVIKKLHNYQKDSVY